MTFDGSRKKFTKKDIVEERNFSRLNTEDILQKLNNNEPVFLLPDKSILKIVLPVVLVVNFFMWSLNFISSSLFSLSFIASPFLFYTFSLCMKRVGILKLTSQGIYSNAPFEKELFIAWSEIDQVYIHTFKGIKTVVCQLKTSKKLKKRNLTSFEFSNCSYEILIDAMKILISRG